MSLSSADMFVGNSKLKCSHYIRYLVTENYHNLITFSHVHIFYYNVYIIGMFKWHGYAAMIRDLSLQITIQIYIFPPNI